MQEERRQSLQPQFDHLATLISGNHAETIQRLTAIETNQKNDRKDLDEIIEQCDEHEELKQRGKGIMMMGGMLGAGAGSLYAAWLWFLAHLPKAAGK